MKARNAKQFQKEFKALLEKYGATISHACDGDTHGISNERILVEDSDGGLLARGGKYENHMSARDVQ